MTERPALAETVTFGDTSDAGGGVLLLPALRPAPVVVLAPAIGGVNEYVTDVAQRLASEGYACLLLDYYAREGGPPDLGDLDKVMAAVARLRDPRVLDDVEQALAYLDERPELEAARVGFLGFCIGGSYSLLAASRFDRLRASVAFYGLIRYDELTDAKPLSPLDAVAQLQCPLLGHFGETDHLVALADVAELRHRTAGHRAEIYTYPGAGHGFHDHLRPQAYRPVAAQEAWQRTLVYLRSYLGDQAPGA